jgi:hypothetical protein
LGAKAKLKQVFFAKEIPYLIKSPEFVEGMKKDASRAG